ncbi:cytochrome b561 and DOMON domain-containing protein At3g25290-like [Salvia hispanica]|uniref:cytochrome b561 and DOMON domain-containing protein At3g25290-like n=1 Tax=Salvia hispanica TaxID=49212 RepID=UPI00200965D1|nr:cytochrome b561 and DOMON domain-containing protein At3g25290-like [Salvia hispanica]
MAAASISSSLLLLLIAAALSSSPALSHTCESHQFSHRNLTYANCTDLPTLNASLHYTYDAAARTLSLAFTAAPASPRGWIAWGLNPTSTGMVGAQSLVAFAAANGSAVVNTYNITSYGPISESPISYGVLSKSAESSSSGGAITIFATLAIPQGSGAAVNQIWQVGSAVVGGVPAKHAFAADNLASKSTLRLDGAAPAPSPGGKVNGGVRNWGNGFGFGLCGICVVIGVSIFGF